MNKIASPQDLQTELKKILAYCAKGNPSRSVVAKALSDLSDRTAKKMKYTDAWLADALKRDPLSTFGGVRDFTDTLIAAAKERDIPVTSMTPYAEVKQRLEAYLSKKGIKVAANKKFDAYIALAADSLKNLRKADVFRVLSEAKTAKELSELVELIHSSCQCTRRYLKYCHDEHTFVLIELK